jgi:HPt (histidine-containing phosphotransfer) domain-containing protein
MQVPVELKRKYIERRLVYLEHLHTCLETEDYSPALRIGHQVKGNALTFDFPQMAPIAERNEFAAKNKDKETLKDLIELMSYELQKASHNFIH